MLLPLLLACAPLRHPVQVWTPPTATHEAAADPWNAVLARPPVVQLETLIDAHWSVAAKGLLNMDDPKTAAAPSGDIDILIMAHLIRHPSAGAFLVDTGIAADSKGRVADTHGLVRGALHPTEVKDIGDELAARNLALAGVFFTHLHLDHIFGLPDIGPDVPFYIGPDEQEYQGAVPGILRTFYRRRYADRPAFRELDRAAAVPMAPFEHAWDVFGDGSFWAIHVPGHTPGSLAFLVNAEGGPVLLTGDTCHTKWGWDNEVEPGTFTHDHAGNKASLHALKVFAAAHPEVKVVLGHQLMQ